MMENKAEFFSPDFSPASSSYCRPLERELADKESCCLSLPSHPITFQIKKTNQQLKRKRNQSTTKSRNSTERITMNCYYRKGPTKDTKMSLYLVILIQDHLVSLLQCRFPSPILWGCSSGGYGGSQSELMQVLQVLFKYNVKNCTWKKKREREKFIDSFGGCLKTGVWNTNLDLAYGWQDPNYRSHHLSPYRMCTKGEPESEVRSSWDLMVHWYRLQTSQAMLHLNLLTLYVQWQDTL